jgi:hypothetical protein
MAGPPNLLGINGPRPGGTRGRLRNSLANMLSKANPGRVYPSAVVARPGQRVEQPGAAPGTAVATAAPAPASAGIPYVVGGMDALPGAQAGALDLTWQALQNQLRSLQDLANFQPPKDDGSGNKLIPNPPPKGGGGGPPPTGPNWWQHVPQQDLLRGLLATTMKFESGGNYQAHAKYGSASGAYQFTDPTWNHYGGYAHAYQAPKAVQDAKARQLMTSYLNLFHGRPDMVLAAWYVGRYGATHFPWDQVPGHNRYTVRQLVNMRMNYLRGLF